MNNFNINDASRGDKVYLLSVVGDYDEGSTPFLVCDSKSAAEFYIKIISNYIQEVHDSLPDLPKEQERWSDEEYKNAQNKRKETLSKMNKDIYGIDFSYKLPSFKQKHFAAHTLIDLSELPIVA